MKLRLVWQKRGSTQEFLKKDEKAVDVDRCCRMEPNRARATRRAVTGQAKQEDLSAKGFSWCPG